MRLEQSGESSGQEKKSERCELRVELRAAEDAERDDVEPEEQGDAGAERAVDLASSWRSG